MAQRTIKVVHVAAGVRALVYFNDKSFNEYKRVLNTKTEQAKSLRSQLMKEMYAEAVKQIRLVYETEIFGDEREFPPKASGAFGANIGKFGSVQPQLGVFTITSTVAQARYFMRNRPPQRVPLQDLIEWAMVKFMVPRSEAFPIALYVQDKILETGVTGQPVFYRALGPNSVFRDIMRRSFEEYASKVVRAK